MPERKMIWPTNKDELSNFVQELAAAYFDELVAHGYRPPPYETSNKPCCTLPMMWRAFEKLGIVKQNNDGTDFEPTNYP